MAAVFATVVVGTPCSVHAQSPARLVDDSRLVYSGAEMLEFDLEDFMSRTTPALDAHSEAIRHWSAYTSISPRVALTLLAVKNSGSLRAIDHSQPVVEPLRQQLIQLATSFYQAFEASDPEAEDGIDRPTAATAALLDVLGSTDQLEKFVETYRELFPGEPALWRSTLYDHSIPLGLKVIPPENLLQLPYPIGRTWSTNGTHSFTGTNSGPPSSLDLARGWPPWGSNTTTHWVAAANSGTAVVHSSCFLEIVGSGGWSTSYYHLDNIIVSTGQNVSRNQRIANYADNLDQALCDAGHSQRPHQHFSLRRNGLYTSLDGVSLSGFRVHAGRFDYDQNCNFFWLEKAGIRYCAFTNITNPGVASSIPVSPDGLTATTASNSEINLTWNDAATNESSYEVQRRGSSWTTVVTLPANRSTYSDHTLESGTSYRYRVRARNSSGSSDWSGEATAHTDGERPPAELFATPLSSTTIQLSWTDRADSEESFEIEQQTPSGSFALVATVPANTELAIVEALAADTEYTFRVRAAGGLGPSTYSSSATASTLLSDPAPCESSSSVVCLNHDRFSVEVTWRNFEGLTGSATPVAIPNSDSGLLWFFSDNNWEMLIKALDGCAINDRFWVFAAATTDVEYELRVTDTYTGSTATYFNELGVASPAITDTDAFSTCSVTVPPWNPGAASTPTRQAFPAPVCEHDEDRLCLVDGRFQIDVEWQDFHNTSGAGQVVPVGSSDSGVLWFFSENNWEMLVKVLNGCSINDHYWVFAAATTDVAYTLTVTDLETGLWKRYSNQLGTAADATTDTGAFAVCDP